MVEGVNTQAHEVGEFVERSVKLTVSSVLGFVLSAINSASGGGAEFVQLIYSTFNSISDPIAFVAVS